MRERMKKKKKRKKEEEDEEKEKEKVDEKHYMVSGQRFPHTKQVSVYVTLDVTIGHWSHCPKA